MYSVAVSLGVALLTGILVGLRYSVYASIFTGFLLGLLVFFLLTRKYIALMQEQMNAALKLLQARKIDQAISLLEGGFQYTRWLVVGESQLNGQIGSIYYMKKEFDTAFKYLQKSFVRDWMPRVMLAALHYRRKEYDQMEAVMERTVKFNGKVPLAWGVYAWFEESLNKPEKALEVLGRAAQANPDDEAIKQNLLNLQNKKKLKMSRFGDIWYNLLFEPPPQSLIQAQMKTPFPPNASALKPRRS